MLTASRGAPRIGVKGHALDRPLTGAGRQLARGILRDVAGLRTDDPSGRFSADDERPAVGAVSQGVDRVGTDWRSRHRTSTATPGRRPRSAYEPSPAAGGQAAAVGAEGERADRRGCDLRRTARGWKPGTSQRMIVLSALPEARTRPVGSKARQVTTSGCPIACGWPSGGGSIRATTSPVGVRTRPGMRKTVMSPRRASMPYPATARNDWPWASGRGETAIA